MGFALGNLGVSGKFIGSKMEICKLYFVSDFPSQGFITIVKWCYYYSGGGEFIVQL